jgi:hypothetical protein
MTAIWGPLGWMTLHSMASNYSDAPTAAEKQLLSAWVDLFRDTITCPSCREHFTVALLKYRQTYPDMFSSRRQLLLATFRIHNAVNQRLSKPIHSSVAACFEQLRNNVKLRSAREYRASYIVHIRRHWRTLQDISGITAMKKINEMLKIEKEYALSHDNNFEEGIEEGLVFLPSRILDSNAEQPSPLRIQTRNLSGGFRLTAGGLRLR